MRRLIAPLGLSLLALFTLIFHQASHATNTPPRSLMEKPLPVDTAVRMGRLPNGLSYYIRHNAEPKGRAEFYILHNVGAILEEDHQNGLAHFTEHMAFNGTEHFPHHKLIDFLEHNGVKFGADVNAFTTQDITCYNVSDVPTERSGLLDSCTQVLCDWSGSIAFAPEEIESERGVIVEEWRTRRTAQWRALSAMQQLLFRGTKYAKRDVIGDIELIKTFSHQSLTDFYHKWYRPEFQAIIIVGDFDAPAMEQRVLRMAGNIAKAKEQTPKPHITMPASKGLHYMAYTDPELPMVRMELIYRHPPLSEARKDHQFYRQDMIRQLAVKMFNARMSELSQQAEPPFLAAFGGYVNLIAPMDNSLFIAISPPGKAKQTLEGLATEMQRVRQNGFQATELERAKKSYLSGWEATYSEREKLPNRSFVQSYMDHFIKGSPIPSISQEMELTRRLLPTITLEEINASMRGMMPGMDVDLFIQAPESEKDKLPTEEEARRILEASHRKTLEPWMDRVEDKPLIAQMPRPGRIVRQEKGPFGTDVWTLSNGMRIIIKPTDFKDDEIRIRGFAKGGLSTLPTEELLSAELATSIISLSGLGEHSGPELAKLQAGHRVATSVSIDDLEVGLSGISTTKPEDVEFMFQRLYLQLTAPRFEPASFNTLMDRLRTILANSEKNPDDIFSKRLRRVLSQDSPRRQSLEMKKLGEVTLSRAKHAYQTLLPNASGLTVSIVGKFNPDSIRPYVLRYLASLPKGKPTGWRDDGVRPPAERTREEFTQVMLTPKTSYATVYYGRGEYNADDLLHLEALEHILGLRYTEEIREERGLTYGVRQSANLRYFPEPLASMYVFFTTDPNLAREAVPHVHRLFEGLQKGISQADVNKAKQHFLKLYGEKVRNNGYWQSIILQRERNGIDLHTGYEARVKSLSPKSLQKTARRIFGKAVRVEVEMNPEK
ncbi:MAG: hypothetical protein CSA07_05165 [Bacteroidia bacterium]|nr:MAG: hypothetical protein CSA07_05165 [Bacteroidia bacterium]